MPGKLQKVVEVFAVTRVTEGLTGESIAQVTFGEMAELTPDLRPFFPSQPTGGMPPKRVGANQLVLFYWGHGEVPYKIGSRWKLRVAPNGALSLIPQ